MYIAIRYNKVTTICKDRKMSETKISEMSKEQLLVYATNLVEKNEELKKNIKQTFRIETTKTHNNFHVSYNKLLDISDVKVKYKHLIVSESDDEIVFKESLKDYLQEEIKNQVRLI